MFFYAHEQSSSDVFLFPMKDSFMLLTELGFVVTPKTFYPTLRAII